MVYDRGSVRLESRIDGNAASTAMSPGYNPGWPWARVEMELLPSGTVNAWLYGHRDTRFRGASASVAVPSGWTPAFRAAGESGDGYLANLYVGKAEAVTTYYDGLDRSYVTVDDEKGVATTSVYDAYGYLLDAEGYSVKKPAALGVPSNDVNISTSVYALSMRINRRN